MHLYNHLCKLSLSFTLNHTHTNILTHTHTHTHTHTYTHTHTSNSLSIICKLSQIPSSLTLLDKEGGRVESAKMNIPVLSTHKLTHYTKHTQRYKCVHMHTHTHTHTHTHSHTELQMRTHTHTRHTNIQNSTLPLKQLFLDLLLRKGLPYTKPHHSHRDS